MTTSPDAFAVFSFHFTPGLDNSGFVGWLASHLKAVTGTGVLVVCGQNSGRGGIFDYWGAPLPVASRVVAEIRRLRGEPEGGPAIAPSACLALSWSRCWAGLGARGGGEPLRDALLAGYGQPHRKYHTLQHLEEVLSLFDGVRGLAARPAEVEAALWFHDAVYDPDRHDNESRSADWARQALLEGGADAEAADRVHGLVMATRHDAVPADPDARLLVDTDLAILGAGHARFDEYERQIRAEYGHVPDTVFEEKRHAILRAFLARPRIFGSGHFHAELEDAARNNLRRALGEARA